MMLKGMTVQYLIRRTYPVQPGETVLFHAAAGGVGLIACQWLKALGRTVIGTVGSDEKAALARAHGCDARRSSTRREDFAERVKEITGGAGVPVVYDSVGKDTFLGSLDCLRPLGLMVELRQRLRAGAAVRHRHPVAEGIALPDAADARRPTPRRARTCSRRRAGAVRRGGERQGEDRDHRHATRSRTRRRRTATSRRARRRARSSCVP